MPFTIEEENGLKSLYGIDIPELLIEGYTEEEIRAVIDQGQLEEQPDITSTAPIEQEEINLPTAPIPEQPDVVMDLETTPIQPELTSESQDFFTNQMQGDALFSGLENINVDQLIQQGYSMEEIQEASKQYQAEKLPDPNSPEVQANLIQQEVAQGVGDVGMEIDNAVNTAEAVSQNTGMGSLGDFQIGEMTLGDVYNNLKNQFTAMYPGLFGYGAEKAGEMFDAEGLYKWGRDLQYGEGGTIQTQRERFKAMTPGGKKTVGREYFDPQVGEFGDKLWDYVFNGKEIRKEDFPTKFWGDANAEKVLMDITGGASSVPLMLSGIGFTKVLETAGVGKLSPYIGVGGTFAVTEGLSVAQSINQLVDGMTHDELYSSPLAQSIDNVLKEKYPDSSPIKREKFIRKQLGNQLAFEYGGYAATFSLITDGGIASMAFKKIRKDVTDAAVSSATKRSFMKRVGNVAYVTSAEFAQEFTQEGLNKLFENFAAQDAGRDIGSFTDVPNAAMSGGFGGAGPGFVLGTGVEVLEGKKAKKFEKKEKIAKAVEEDRKIAEEEGDVLPQGVNPTESEQVWTKRGLDENEDEVDYLIGYGPSVEDADADDVIRIAIPDPTGQEQTIILEKDFATLQEASDYIDQLNKPKDEVVIEEVVDEAETTDEEEQVDVTEDEQEDVEGVDEVVSDEELIAEEDDPTVPVDIEDPIEEEVVDEEPTEEPPVEDDIPESGTLADLRAKERDVISEIESLREIDPSDPAILFVEDELSEIQNQIAEEEAINEELVDEDQVVVGEKSTFFLPDGTSIELEVTAVSEAGSIKVRNEKGKEEIIGNRLSTKSAASPDYQSDIFGNKTVNSFSNEELDVAIKRAEEIVAANKGEDRYPSMIRELNALRLERKRRDADKTNTAEVVEEEVSDERERFAIPDEELGDIRVEIRDHSTLLITDNKGERLITALISPEGETDNKTFTKAGMEVRSNPNIIKAVNEAKRRVKEYFDRVDPQKPLESGKPKAKKEINPIWTEDIDQKVSSADTSQAQTPKGVTTIIKKALVKAGQVIADIGGGKYDIATKMLKSKGITNLVFDPFNRARDWNLKVAKKIQNGGADVSTVFNVLNVIKEKAGRIKVLKQAQNATKAGGKIFIGVYEDTTTGNKREAEGLERGSPTTKGWQNRQKLSWYRKEVEQVFGKENVTSKDGLLVVTKPKAKKSKGKKTKVFHGGSGTTPGLFYVSEDKSEAGLYGKDVVEYVIDEDTIIDDRDDDTARQILVDIGAIDNKDDGMMMEFLDRNFPDYYIGNKNVLKFRKEMKKRGYTGVRFTDNTADEGKTNSVTNIVLIDRPKAKVKDDKPKASGKPKGKKDTEKYEEHSRQSPLHKLKNFLKPKEKVIKKSDIITWFEKTFKKRIKPFATIISKQAGGLFFPNSESVRIKNPNDIEVASHEMAHWLETEIDRSFSGEGGVSINGKNYKKEKGKMGQFWMDARRSLLSDEMQQELRELDYDETKQRNYEGFAEYFRMLLSGHDLSQKKKNKDHKTAPKFHKFFMEKILGNKAVKEHFNNEFGLDMLNVIEEGKALFSRWYRQGSLNRAFAFSGLTEDRTPFLAKIRKVWEKVEDFFNKEYDQLHILEMKVKEINKIRKRNGMPPLRPSQDPFQIATAESLAHAKIASTLMNDRMINHNAEELFVVTEKGDTNLEIGQTVTEEQLKQANEGKKNQAKSERMKTLVESLSQIKEEDMNSFVVYGVALRANQMHKRGLESGMDRIDIEYILTNKKEYGWDKTWDQAWQDVTDWHGALLDWLVDAGRLSKDAKELMQAANPVYLPFKRAFVDEEVRKGGGNIMTPSSLKKLKGSTRELLNPLEAIEVHATSIISLAIKSRIMTAIADLAPINGIGDMIARVPGKARSMNALIGPLKTQIKQVLSGQIDAFDMDTDEKNKALSTVEMLVEEIADEEQLKIFYRDYGYEGTKDNPVVPIFRNGKVYLYEVDKGLHKAVLETTRFEHDMYAIRMLLKIMRPFASMMRIGWTGLNIKFNFWTNPMRDVPLAAIYTKGRSGFLSHPFKSVKGIITAMKNWLTDDFIGMKNGEWNLDRRYTASGGNIATAHGYDQALYQAQVGKLNLARKGIKKTLLFVKHPLKGLSTFLGGLHGILSTTELGPRLTEFKTVYEKTKKISERAQQKQKRKEKLTAEEADHLDWTEEDHYIYAKRSAKDITFNFTKTGRAGKYINQAWPFHNATMQGPNKAYRSLKENPYQFFYRSFRNITIPALISFYASKDEEWYKNIQGTYNDMNLFLSADDIPGLGEILKNMGVDPKNKILVIPIPHETGVIFGSIPRAALDEFMLGRHGAIWQSMKSALDLMMPSIIKDLLSGQGPKPAITAPFQEVGSNNTHFGRTVVPPYMMNSWSPKLPEDQVYPWSSLWARETTKLLQKIYKFTEAKGKPYNPIQLDYLLKQYTGGLGTTIITFVEDKFFGKKSNRGPMAVTLRYPNRPTRQIELFYLEMNELKAKKGGDKATNKELARLKRMSDFKKNNLDPLNERKRRIGKEGVPEDDSDMEKMTKIYKTMSKKLNGFLGNKYKDLKR